jgi:hypothetical protein
MFKRNGAGVGKISSDDGFSVAYGHKTVLYTDQRGTFQIGYEDGLIFPDSLRLMDPIRPLSEPERTLIIERILSALEWDGQDVAVFRRL